MHNTRSLVSRPSLSALLLVLACNAASAESEGVEPGFSELELVATAGLLGDANAAGETGGEPDEFAELEDAPDDDAVEIDTEPEPIAWRVTKRRLNVYAEPSKASPVRGRIPIHKTFEVFANVEGPGCGGLGWADVGSNGFVCLQETREAKSQRLRELPAMRAGLTPYFYAKVKSNGTVARRWRNIEAYISGKEPTATLTANTDYAFKYRKRHKGKVLLVDDRGRVVLEREVHRYRPSRFAGRDLVESPVPAGRRLAWAVRWPEASARTEPATDAKLAASVGYHDELLVDPNPIEGKGGSWYRLANGAFLRASDVQVFLPSAEVPSDVPASEIWLDVDLEQQTLAAMRGDTPLFATLISSGFKRATPRGVFRIHWKQAIGGMQSDPGSDDPYNVEAVPHVQYFLGGFALHSAYWHNFFGRRISHGCVNLAPKDALRVFRMTSPHLRGGWDHALETSHKLGTTVRIRKGDQMPRDRRRDPEANFRDN